jgi:very-short-patch-repair endonuclease
MRSDMTVGEHILWQELRGRRFGAKFRRQQPIGPWIPDFVCYQHRLIIEVDGDSHTDMKRDRERDRWFTVNGWFVLRFWDHQVITTLDEVLDTIWLAICDRGNVRDPLNLES